MIHHAWLSHLVVHQLEWNSPIQAIKGLDSGEWRGSCGLQLSAMPRLFFMLEPWTSKSHWSNLVTKAFVTFTADHDDKSPMDLCFIEIIILLEEGLDDDDLMR